MTELHDRQPVIIEPRDYNEWMKPSERPPLHPLRITPKEEMKVELVDVHNVQLPLNSM
jgi:putative SOS response-associated peptidase YedK